MERDELLEDVDVDLTNDADEDTEPNRLKFVGLALYTGLYVLLSLVIGFLYTTPIYVLIYALWFDIPKAVIVVMVLTSLGFIYGMMILLNIPFDKPAIEIPLLTTSYV